MIRQVILSCSSYLNVSHVRTWNEIVAFYLNEISFDQAINEQITRISEETKDKLAKIEWDMAEIICPILLSQNGDKLELMDIVSKYACQITKEEYLSRESQSKYSSDIKFIFSLKQDLIFSLKIKDDFQRFLSKLDVQRHKSLQMIEKCRESIEAKRLKVIEKKAKLTRLENALVNPHQINQT